MKAMVDQDLASLIIVSDKSLPALGNFSPAIQAAFDQKSKVKFIQSDLSKDQHVQRVFKEEFGITHVVNLCGETRFGLPAEDYKHKCVETATKCGKAAKALNISKFIEVSTAQVYKPSKQNSSEDESKLDPWTLQASSRLEAENVIKQLELPLVILRPVFVYGPGDLTGITPRLATAAAYKHMNEKMKNMWGADLRIDVVHVDDVVQAIIKALFEIPSGEVFNLSDKSELTQGKLNSLIEELFGIKTGFLGTMVSKMTETVGLSRIVDHANEKHLPAWQKICQEHGVLNTPVSPYVDKELLYNRHLAVDGSKIEQCSGFSYKHPRITLELIKDQLDAFIHQKLFPAILI